MAILAAVGGVGYAVAWQIMEGKRASVGYSAYCYLAGAAAAIAAMWIVWHLTPSAAPAYAGQPALQAAPPPVPACSGCGAPTVWVAQYNRFFCQRCQVYV